MAVATKIEHYTNQIQDDVTRKAVWDLVYKINQNNFYQQISGTAMTATAAELNKLDGASVTVTEMDQRVFQCDLANVCTASTAITLCPWTGTINTIYSVTHDDISGGTPVITFSVTGVAMAGNTITMTTLGKAGMIDSVAPTGSFGAVGPTKYIRITSDGAGVGTGGLSAVRATFIFLVDL